MNCAMRQRQQADRHGRRDVRNKREHHKAGNKAAQPAPSNKLGGSNSKGVASYPQSRRSEILPRDQPKSKKEADAP